MSTDQTFLQRIDSKIRVPGAAVLLLAAVVAQQMIADPEIPLRREQNLQADQRACQASGGEVLVTGGFGGYGYHCRAADGVTTEIRISAKDRSAG